MKNHPYLQALLVYCVLGVILSVAVATFIGVLSQLDYVTWPSVARSMDQRFPGVHDLRVWTLLLASIAVILPSTVLVGMMTTWNGGKTGPWFV